MAQHITYRSYWYMTCTLSFILIQAETPSKGGAKELLSFSSLVFFFCLNSHCATSTSKYQKIISKRWLKGKRLSSHAIFDLCFELLPQFNGRKKTSIQKLHVINFWEKAADLHAACVFCKHLACVNLSCLRGEQQEVTTLESHLPRPSGSHVTYIGRK